VVIETINQNHKPKIMEKTLCQITTQYYENYGDSQNPYWKPKGGQVFNVMVDSDEFMYGGDACIEAIQELLAKESDWHSKYEYLDYELIFSRPIVLNETEFADTLTRIYQKNYPKVDALVDEEGKETLLGKIIDEGDYEQEF
jgi:hypothetical protein